MLKRFLTFALFLFVFSPALHAAPAAWRVEGKGGAMIVFGTMHRLPDGFDWFSDQIKQQLKDSRVLILETQISQVGDDYVGYLIRQPGVATSKKPLRERLGKEDYKNFLGRVLSAGYSEKEVANYRPWYAALLVSRLNGDEAGLERSKGVEQTLSNFARVEGIELVGLESPGQQFRNFSNLPKKVELSWLENVLKEENADGAESKKLSEAWISGNLKAIEELALKSLKETPGLYKVLVKDRNQAWAGKLTEFLEEGGQAFVAVGAAHMVGRDSVLAYLEKEGFSVTRIQ